MDKKIEEISIVMRGIRAGLICVGVGFPAASCSGDDDDAMGAITGSEDVGTTGVSGANSSNSSNSSDSVYSTSVNGEPMQPVGMTGEVGVVEATDDDSTSGDPAVFGTGSSEPEGTSSEGGDFSEASVAEQEDEDTFADVIASIVSELHAHSERANLIVAVESSGENWIFSYEG